LGVRRVVLANVYPAGDRSKSPGHFFEASVVESTQGSKPRTLILECLAELSLRPPGAPEYRGDAEERKREKNEEAKVHSAASALPFFRDEVPPLWMGVFASRGCFA